MTDEPTDDDRSPGESESEPTETPTAEPADGEAPTRREGRAPLDDLSQKVRERRADRASEEADEEDLFEEVDVGDVDVDEVWDELLGEERAEAEGKAVGAGTAAEEVRAGDADRRAEHVLPKAEFCERCPYLSAPPELGCTHDGTDIVEVTDVEHFRVRGCPFAVEDEPAFEEFG
ncbi:MAG: hypothetical protein ABEJ74_08715 [Haloferacaceae archaeon]